MPTYRTAAATFAIQSLAAPGGTGLGATDIAGGVTGRARRHQHYDRLAQKRLDRVPQATSRRGEDDGLVGWNTFFYDLLDDTNAVNLNAHRATSNGALWTGGADWVFSGNVISNAGLTTVSTMV